MRGHVVSSFDVRLATGKPRPAAEKRKHRLLRPEATEPPTTDTQVRRLAAQALGRNGWSPETLIAVATALLDASAPDAAEGALIAVHRAREGLGSLRLNLIGALAVPGWPSATLNEIAGWLLADLPNRDTAEIAALRGLSREARS